MIPSSTTQSVGETIRTIVTRICSSLYAAANSQRNNTVFDEQLAVQALTTSNRLGVTDFVKNWFETSEQYKRSLSEMLNESFASSDHVSKLLLAGDSYWSSYGLGFGGETPTAETLYKHQFSYKLASQASQASGSASDTQKIHACIYDAASRCIYDQFEAAYGAFFSDSPSLGSYSGVAAAAKKLIVCEPQVETYTAPANTTSGDSSSNVSAVPTLSDGSAMKTVPRNTYTRVSEPFSAHINNTSTLHTRMMMSDLSENMIDSYDHARIANTYDKIQTSSEYFDDMVKLFESSVAIEIDSTIPSLTNTKLQNRFLYNQIGEHRLSSNDSVSETRLLKIENE